MYEYQVKPLNTSLFGGSLDPKKLENALNEEAGSEWEFVRSIHETKKVLGVFKREAHFLVYKRKKN